MFSITGLASGLDTDNMVRQLLQVERMPITRLERQQAALRKVDDAWGQITTRLSSLRTAIDGLTEGAALAARWTTASSNEAAATATVTGAPTAGSTTVTVDQLATAQSSHSATAGAFATADALVGAGTFRLLGADGTELGAVTADGTTTLAQLATSVDAIAGVHAQVVKKADGDHRLVLGSERTGTADAFTVDTDLASFAGGFQTTAAADALLTIGGLQVTRSSNTVADLIDGVTLTLAGTGATTVTTTRDIDSAVSAVTELVDEVNATLAKLTELSSYDAESKTGGPLQGDATARRMVDQLRRGVMDVVAGVTGSFATAGSVGISMDADGGFTVDEAKLEAALAADPGAVDQLVSRSATGGIAGRLDQLLVTYEGTTGAVERARTSVKGRIDLYQDRIDDFEHRITSRETTIRRQFTAMETALAQLQSQGNWLAGQLAAFAPPPPQ